jgi:hypothetical protein
LECAKYSHLKESPYTLKEEIRHYSSQPSQPVSELHGATKQQQAIAKTAAK